METHMGTNSFEMPSLEIKHELYQLIMTFSDLSPVETRILILLCHIYPQRVNGLQLTQLLGYNKKSRIIYRGSGGDSPLVILEGMNFLTKVKNGGEYQICVNTSHPVIQTLVDLSGSWGIDYCEELDHHLKIL